MQVQWQKTMLHGGGFLLALAVILYVENFNLGITIHMLSYLAVTGAFFKTLLKPSLRSVRRAFFLLFYFSLLSIQLHLLLLGDFGEGTRLIVACSLFITFLAEQIWSQRQETFCVSPVLDENSISFEDLRYLKQRVEYRKKQLKRVGGIVTFPFIWDIAKEIPRNCSLRYMAKESLSDTYFKHLEESLTDPYVYLVFSDTGSPASNLIGIFTNKPYNHISISFDAQLKTLVSYNGGERVSPPGLNQEMLEWFYQKEDASIRIYRLAVTLPQKKAMAQRISAINAEGSAYNAVGAMIGKTIQPNMMVCSEFVYHLLDSVGAAYFKKTAIDVKPADLIELDYERKLEFMESIQLSTFCDEMVEKGKPLPQGGKPLELEKLRLSKE